LPPLLKGLFLTGLLATIMSTVDSYSFLAAMTIGRDYLARFKKFKKIPIRTLTRFGLVLTAGLSIMIAIYAQSVVRIWKDLGSIGTPALLIPLVSSFFPRFRMRAKFVVWTMVSGSVVSAFWILTKALNLYNGEYLFNIEPIYPGLLVTVFLFLFVGYCSITHIKH
jgi:SSS family solute:Na+ symporter